MNCKKILITSVCGDIGISVVQALAAHDYKIVGTDMTSYCPVEDLLCSFFTLPAAQDESYVEKLCSICRREGVNIVLPISEAEILKLDEHRHEVEARGLLLVINNSQIISTFSDKLLTAEYFKKNGYCVPVTMPLARYDESLRYPFVVKSRQGYGSKSLWHVHDQVDLEYLRKKDTGNLIAQENVGCPDEEYTTGVFSDGDKTAAISFRRKLGYGGLSREVHLEHIPFLQEMAEFVAKDLKLVGSINIQTRKVNEDYVPFEVNPRISSTVMFRALLGFEDVHWWVEALKGNTYSYTPCLRKVVGIRYMAEKLRVYS